MITNTNNPVYSVSEFSHVIKKLVETNFSYVRIRGEISRPSFPGSGHVYFTLKDTDGTITLTVDGEDGFTEITIPGAGEFFF